MEKSENESPTKSSNSFSPGISSAEIGSANKQPLRSTVPLRVRKILKKSLGKIILLSIPSAIVLVLYFAAIEALHTGETGTFGSYVLKYESSITFFVVGFFVVLVLWSPFWEYLYFRFYFYDMDEKNVVIRKGVITKREITLPFSKITDVYVDQDILDFILCLFDLHISTPTIESGRFAHIDGLDRAGSKLLKKIILERVNIEEK